MKNRYIPFGYQIQNGDSVINTEQAATVQHIFYAYTEGQSFKEIAEYLTTSGTAYHFSDNSWNKNIVARILANEIYCGAKGYPAIISKEVYSQAASIPKRLTLYRAIHSYTNARTGKSKTLADAGITFWESELLHDGYRITDQTGTRASRPYTTKIG